LCSNYPCYSHLPSSDPARLPVACQIAGDVLCLPLYGTLDPAVVERICEIIAALQGATV
jgi:dTDP-4-amino-4,6-dideoxygalactose transaminase